MPTTPPWYCVCSCRCCPIQKSCPPHPSPNDDTLFSKGTVEPPAPPTSKAVKGLPTSAMVGGLPTDNVCCDSSFASGATCLPFTGDTSATACCPKNLQELDPATGRAVSCCPPDRVYRRLFSTDQACCQAPRRVCENVDTGERTCCHQECGADGSCCPSGTTQCYKYTPELGDFINSCCAEGTSCSFGE
jgi:hypothetical protein